MTAPHSIAPGPNPRRAVPSVERVLQALGPTGLPRVHVVATVRRVLAEQRVAEAPAGFDEVLGRVHDALRRLARQRLRPVINATGVLLHTNLGRAPLAPAAVAAVSAVASGYCNLELDLEAGTRGPRAGYLERSLAALCGAEAATIVNNGAAALVLALRHFTRERREVVISRGELVQIGGGFRIPEILEASGARLREVGTTNQTTLDDYAAAIGPETGLILKVHHSNFFMAGFVAAPEPAALGALARERGVPCLEDIGSGAVFPTEDVAAAGHEPTPAEVLARGIDLVVFSGDKLLGGPQAGIIAGREPLVAALKRAPFFRALRCDKLVFAALEATVDLHLRGEAEALPLLAMARTSPAALRKRGARICAELGETDLEHALVETEAEFGGGSLPRARIPSVALALRRPGIAAGELGRRLAHGEPAVIGTVARERVCLDLRTVLPAQDRNLVAALLALARTGDA